MAKSTCGACGVIFSSVSAFDAYRVGTFAKPGSRKRAHGNRRCLALLDMQARGMAQNERGWWTTGAKLPVGAFEKASA